MKSADGRHLGRDCAVGRRPSPPDRCVGAPAADDHSQAQAKDQSQHNAGAEHPQRVQCRQGLAEDLRGVLRAIRGVVGDQRSGERSGTARQQDSQDDEHRTSTPLLAPGQRDLGRTGRAGDRRTVGSKVTATSPALYGARGASEIDSSRQRP